MLSKPRRHHFLRSRPALLIGEAQRRTVTASRTSPMCLHPFDRGDRGRLPETSISMTEMYRSQAELVRLRLHSSFRKVRRGCQKGRLGQCGSQAKANRKVGKQSSKRSAKEPRATPRATPKVTPRATPRARRRRTLLDMLKAARVVVWMPAWRMRRRVTGMRTLSSFHPGLVDDHAVLAPPCGQDSNREGPRLFTSAPVCSYAQCPGDVKAARIASTLALIISRKLICPQPYFLMPCVTFDLNILRR